MSKIMRRDLRETAALTNWANTLDWSDIPTPVRRSATFHFLDAYGVAVATTATEFGQRVLDTLPQDDTGPAQVIGSPRRVDGLRAAIVNGSLVHGLEFDDTHIPSVIHGSAVALATVLSQAHHPGVTVGDMMSGFVIAWEVLVRLGLLAPGGYQDRGFQTAAVCGAPAAAIAAGRLRGCTPTVMDDGFAIATSFSSGLMAYAADGATVKRTHLGWAAHGGVAAIEMAEVDVSGPSRPLTAANGFLEVLAGLDQEPDLHEAFGDIGRRWHLLDASYKLHPVCHYIHAYLDLAAELRQQCSVEAIDSVECDVHPSVASVISDGEEQRRRPRSFGEAQYSLHYAVAQMFIHGSCDLLALQQPSDPATIAFAERVRAVRAADLDFPGMFPGAMRVRGREGQVLAQGSVRGPRGATVKESDLVGEIRTKFVHNTASRWSASHAEETFERLSDMDALVDEPAGAVLT